MADDDLLKALRNPLANLTSMKAANEIDRLRAALVEVRSRAKILDSATLLDIVRIVDAAIGRPAETGESAPDAAELAALRHTAQRMAVLREFVQGSPWFDPVKHAGRDAVEVIIHRDVELTARAVAPASVAPEKCEWTYAGDDWGTWETACGESFVFEDGGPDDNLVRFCCYCGKPAVEVVPDPELCDDDEDDERAAVQPAARPLPPGGLCPKRCANYPDCACGDHWREAGAASTTPAVCTCIYGSPDAKCPVHRA